MNKLSSSICKCVSELTPTRTHTRFSPTWLRMANCLITGFCSQLDWVGEANHRAQHVTLAEVKPTLAVAAIQVCCPLSQSPPLSHTEHTLATHSLQFGQGLTIRSAWRQSGEELLHIMIRCWYLGLYIYSMLSVIISRHSTMFHSCGHVSFQCDWSVLTFTSFA